MTSNPTARRHTPTTAPAGRRRVQGFYSHLTHHPSHAPPRVPYCATHPLAYTLAHPHPSATHLRGDAVAR